MLKKMILKIRNKEKGQGIVEFALVLPVIMLITLGVIEIGYLLFSYSSVNSAAREAARYGIAIGDVSGGGQRYYDCSGIIDAGLSIGSFANMSASEFTISYDDGPPPEGQPRNVKYSSCTDLASYGGSDNIEFGDRIVVEVNHTYTPLVAYMGVGIGPFTMTTTSSRTIVKGVELASSGDGGGGSSGDDDDDSTGDDDVVDCYILDVDHTGAGSDPAFSPSKSSECSTAYTFTNGATIYLTAQPSPGWGIDSWVNTADTGAVSTTTATMGVGGLNVVANYVEEEAVCYTLNLTHTGEGANPVASPTNSTDCSAGMYIQGENITLTASPNTGSGYVVGSWSGTNDNGSTSDTNYLTMPGNNTTASVNYVLDSGVPDGCYALTLTHTGNGSDPVASPSSSGGCPEGYYTAWTSLNLTASPAEDSGIANWNGTWYDASTSTTNGSQIQTSDKTVSVDYVIVEVLGGPTNPSVTFSWQNGQKYCRNITFYWQSNSSWTESPIGYRVFYNGSYATQVTGNSWGSWYSIDNLQTGVIGIQAVFVQDLQYSQTLEVTYLCSNGNMFSQGEVIKEAQ